MSDPQRFARLVLAAFEAAGRITDAEIGRAGGPSTSTLTKYRAAKDGGVSLAKPRSQTWQAIEAAANWPPGSARAVWDGGDPPTGVRTIGHTEKDGEDLVSFEITGNFGVSAVVKGPIKDLDALQAAASRLIEGMQIGEESKTRASP